MSSTINTKNIMYRKKSLGNGDLSNEINRDLKSNKIKQSKALQSQIKKMTMSMKNFDATNPELSKTQYGKTKLNNSRMEKEKNDFRKGLKQIYKNQRDFEKKILDNKNAKNPNDYFSKKQRLPKTLGEIDENIELAKLLLKNPEKMTEEEKVYIASFNDREFKLFIEYLKMKDRELKWKGNGYGSGHYLEGFISIYRKCGHKENERFASLRKFLKMNYQGVKNKEDNENAGKKKANGLWGEEDVNADCNANDETAADDDYEKTNQELKRQMDLFIRKINGNKDELEFQKFQNTNEMLLNELERKKEQLQNDINRMEDMKKNATNELDELYQQYIANNDILIGRKNNVIGTKIRDYMKRNKMDPIDLAKMFATENNFVYFDDDFVKKFVDLKILTEDEAKSVCKILKKYNGERVIVEIFANFLSSGNEVEEKTEATGFEEEEDFGGDNAENVISEEENESDDSYDNYKPKRKKVDVQMEKLKNKLTGRYLKELEAVLQKKNAIFIQRMFKGYLMRKKVKSERIYIYILVNRIIKAFRRNYERKMAMKNVAAIKITYLLRKNFWKKKDLSTAKEFSSRWLQDTRTSKTHSSSAYSNQMAIRIQKAWHEYKSRSKVKIDKKLIKSKFCFICNKHNVTHLCIDCDKTNYCESCFRKFHMRGLQRNHKYIIVDDSINKKEFDPKKIDLRETIKAYMKEHALDLFDKLKMWDFKNNKRITLTALKDALAMIGIEEEMSKKIVDYAMNFVINTNDKDFVIDLDFAKDLSFE